MLRHLPRRASWAGGALYLATLASVALGKGPPKRTLVPIHKPAAPKVSAKLALVIGNGSYRLPLNNALNDADDMARTRTTGRQSHSRFRRQHPPRGTPGCSLASLPVVFRTARWRNRRSQNCRLTSSFCFQTAVSATISDWNSSWSL